jgi:plastocyanin
MPRFKIGLIVLAGLLIASVSRTPGAAAGGGCRGFPVTTGDGVVVTMDDALCFTPTVLYVEPGEEVTWQNTGAAVSHSVAGANTSWGNYEIVAPGESVTLTFDSPGTFSYYCFEHNGMVGTVVVGDGKGDATSVQALVPAPEDEGSGLPLWSLATVGALTGMVATGAVGVVLGRRRG